MPIGSAESNILADPINQMSIAEQEAVFYEGTRLKRVPFSTFSFTASGGTAIVQLPRAGFLQRVLLDITSVVASAGGVTGASVYGMASAIQNVLLRPNAANDIINVSGTGWLSLVNPFLGLMQSVGINTTYNQGASTVAAGTFKLCMELPVAMNNRDSIGLFNLQNPTTTVNLQVVGNPAAGGGQNSSMATSGIDTVATTVIPYTMIMDLFDPNVLPPQNYLHQIKEDLQVSAASGILDYQPELGQVYLSCNHRMELNSTGAPVDTFTLFESYVNGSDYWRRSETLNLVSMDYSRYYGGAARPTGIITDDFMATTELGTLSGYDRDLFDTANTTDWHHRITVPTAQNTRTVRRQLVALSQAG